MSFCVILCEKAGSTNSRCNNLLLLCVLSIGDLRRLATDHNFDTSTYISSQLHHFSACTVSLYTVTSIT